MESASLAHPEVGAETGSKGLKKNAISYVSSVVIGVASTAPGYSLAAVLGFIAAEVGFQSPAIMWVAFIPMLFIATAYLYMNRADPDCGTTFSWVAKAMGPWAGWMGGWAIIVADIIVMANLAQIAGLYSFYLFDSAADPSTFLVTAAGVVWIMVMTAICTIGIELSAKTQRYLLSAEVITLTAFAIVALIKVYAGTALDTAVKPELSWFSPFAIDSTGALTAGVLIAVFIYWGWDSAVTVNEETEDTNDAPGRSAVTATIILVLIYVLVSTAAQAFGGTKQLVDNSDDVLSALGGQVFPDPFDKLVIIAVLTSAAASTQTTILPTARTSLSMARFKALPRALGDVHPRFLTPHVSTILMGVLSIVWYVGLTIVSEDILFDSIAALGLMIAFYYALSGFACAIYYRRELTKSVKDFFYVGVAPFLGGAILTYVFIKSIIDLSKPENSESGDSWFGLGPPLVIGIGFLLLGVLLMVLWARANPDFFRRKAETFTPPGPEPPPAPASAPAGGS
jgi:amino acid transporter